MWKQRTSLPADSNIFFIVFNYQPLDSQLESEFYLRRDHECDAVGEWGVEIVVGGAVVEEVVDGGGEGYAAP